MVLTFQNCQKGAQRPGLPRERCGTWYSLPKCSAVGKKIRRNRKGGGRRRKAAWSSPPGDRDLPRSDETYGPLDRSRGLGGVQTGHQHCLPCPRGQRGQGRRNPLRFPYLLFTCTVPPNPGDTFLPFSASPPLCPWQDSTGMGGGGDPVGQGSRTTPQAPSHQGPRFTQLQNDWDRLQGPLARVFSGQDAAPFRESLKSGCFQCPGLTQHLCLF